MNKEKINYIDFSSTLYSDTDLKKIEELLVLYPPKSSYDKWFQCNGIAVILYATSIVEILEKNLKEIIKKIQHFSPAKNFENDFNIKNGEGISLSISRKITAVKTTVLLILSSSKVVSNSRVYVLSDAIRQQHVMRRLCKNVEENDHETTQMIEIILTCPKISHLQKEEEPKTDAGCLC